jgi:hypothetical protein
MIIRERRPNRYVIIPNEAVQNHALSFKARGVLAYLLSQPDHWTISGTALAKMAAQDGREAIRTALVELEQAGYLVRRRVQDPTTGRWGWHQVLHDQPVHKRGDNPVEDDRAEVRLPDVGKPHFLESTNQKVLTEKTSRDSYAREPHRLCTTCNGNGWHITGVDQVERCERCQGSGVAA